MGLQTHESFDDNECDFVGLHFSGTDHQIRLSWRRIWRFKLGIEFLLDRGVATGHELQIIIGHITWAMLARRESLAILDACYAFARSGEMFHRLWKAVVRELRTVVYLLPLKIVEASITWSEKVYCTDSSDTRYGVMTRQINGDTVAH